MPLVLKGSTSRLITSVLLAVSIGILTGCFDSDSPLFVNNSKPSHEILLGVWQVENAPSYWQVNENAGGGLQIQAKEFGDDGKFSDKLVTMTGFVHVFGTEKILVIENSENKWGHYLISFGDYDKSLTILPLLKDRVREIKDNPELLHKVSATQSNPVIKFIKKNFHTIPVYAPSEDIDAWKAFQASETLKKLKPQSQTKTINQSSTSASSSQPMDVERIARADNELGDAYYYGKGVAQSYPEAFTHYRKAADRGLAEAQHNLGYMYTLGEGVTKNEEKGFELYSLAAKQGFVRSQANLGKCYLHGKGVRQDSAKAVYWLSMAAEKGDSAAQYDLGYCYSQGEGVPKNDVTAFQWFSKSADQGDITAQLYLGHCYSGGIGVGVDHGKAAKWFLTAAEQGNADAQCHYGMTLITGQGHTQKQQGDGLDWLKKAASNGCARAYLEIAMVVYEEAKTKPYGKILALHWAEKAVENGYISAHMLIATIHSEGSLIEVLPGGKIASLPSNKKRAYAILTKLTDKNNLPVFIKENYFTLEYLYYELAHLSLDVREYDMAFVCFSKGADLDDPDAIYGLAHCYENGLGCEMDLERALSHYSVASVMGSKAATNRMLDLNHPKEFVECANCYGSGRVPETTVSYKNCPVCGGTRGKWIRR